MSNAKYIRPGQRLQIPTEGYAQYRKTSMVSTSKTTKIYHTVRRGDTLSEIAMRYRTSIRKIKKWNGPLENLPVFEPGLSKVVSEARNRNLFFSNDIKGSIEKSEMIFMAVNTPTKTAK